ncbi:MAG: response regulator transcription factor [Eubacteriaceae bacterium]|nr:response regulator transcription factor [Eubacteriaceae bacterium]
MNKIYIVEDDEDIREAVAYSLESAGFETIGFESGSGFFNAIQNELPSLAILDIMLPREDGLVILKQLRDRLETKTLPIIMLTAKGSEMDKVKGLDWGADDYITKPFGVLELISRVNALMRRSDMVSAAAGNLRYGGIEIDNARRSVSVDGKTIVLTYKEYELLSYLLLNTGLALERDKIMDAVWGIDYEGESRTLDMHIRTLRQKLGDSGSCIKTIRNVGYKLGE